MTEAELLATWKKTRAPDLAMALAELPVDPRWQTRLKQIARARHDRARPRIKTLPDDPRVTDFFLDCLKRSVWPYANAGGLWSLILDRLVTLRDVRALEPLRAAVVTPPQFSSARHAAAMVEKFRTAVTALERACAGIAAPKRAVAAATDLYTPIWANPSDDAARLVVADTLLERNDPHGEFITLQFKLRAGRSVAAEKARAKTLLRKHGASFAGPLARVTTRAHWDFEKGFLSSCQVVPTDRMLPRSAWEAAVTSVYWSTVERVWLGGYGAPGWWLPRWARAAPLVSLVEAHLGKAVLRRSNLGAPWVVTTAPPRTAAAAHELLDLLRSR